MQLGVLKTLHSWTRRVRNQRELVQDKKIQAYGLKNTRTHSGGKNTHRSPLYFNLQSTLPSQYKIHYMNTQEGLQQGKKQVLRKNP